MALAGKAVLAIWNGIAPEAEAIRSALTLSR